MKEILAGCPIFRGMDDAMLARIVAITRRQAVAPGERPFLLGQKADDFYVVLHGRLDLCLPIPVLGTMRDVTVESKGPGSPIGWSAFVKPHRYRLSARSPEGCELAVLGREPVNRLLQAHPELASAFMERVAEVIAQRLLTVQALWARELQRYVLGEGAVAVEG